jgi:hypothetical protein
MTVPSYTTNVRRAIAALAAGAAVGALGTIAPTLLAGLLSIGEPGGFRSQHVGLLMFMLVVAFIVWSIGLVLVGAPMWWLFHRKGRRSRREAVAVGAVTTFLVNLGLNAGFSVLMQLDSGGSYSAGDSGGKTIINDQLTAHGWWNAIQESILLAIVGVIVALVIWQIAYRRFEQPT